MKQRASVYRHGNRYFVGAMAFFANHPGATSSTIATTIGGDDTPSDSDLGSAVLDMINSSGILDTSLIARGEPGRSFRAASLDLPSDAVLEGETVTVTVSLRKGQLMIDPMQTLGPGGGFGGNGFETTYLPPDSDPAAVGAAVREATEVALSASADVLLPPGSWRAQQTPEGGLPDSGVVTARRIDGSWVVTTRLGARGGGETGQPSSVARTLRADTGPADLGEAIMAGLRAEPGPDTRGTEPDKPGEGQVLIEGEGGQLLIYPQAIDPETGQWDTPAHSDLRTVFTGATTEEIGRAAHLTMAEAPAHH